MRAAPLPATRVAGAGRGRSAGRRAATVGRGASRTSFERDARGTRRAVATRRKGRGVQAIRAVGMAGRRVVDATYGLLASRIKSRRVSLRVVVITSQSRRRPKSQE